MERLILTENKTKELRRAHRLAKDKREADRIKAIYLLSRGKTRQEIAEVLMLDEDTIDNYQKRMEVYAEDSSL